MCLNSGIDVSERDVDVNIWNLMREAKINPRMDVDAFVELAESLRYASKTGNGNRGKPDIVAKVQNTYLLVENKADPIHLVKLKKNGELDMSLEAIKDYAVNGAANYLKHAIKYVKGFDSVIGFGCSYSENVGANIIPLYYDKEMFVNDRNPLVLRSVNDFSKFNVYNLSKTIRGLKNPSKADINEIITNKQPLKRMERLLLKYFKPEDISVALGMLMIARLSPAFCVNLMNRPEGAEYFRKSILAQYSRQDFDFYFEFPDEAIDLVACNRRFFSVSSKKKISASVEFYNILDKLPIDGITISTIYCSYIADQDDFYPNLTYEIAKNIIRDNLIPSGFTTFEFTSRHGVLTDMLCNLSWPNPVAKQFFSVCTDPQWIVSDLCPAMYISNVHTYSEGDSPSDDDFLAMKPYIVIGDLTSKYLADDVRQNLKTGLGMMMRKGGRGLFLLRESFMTSTEPIDSEFRAKVAKKYSISKIFRYGNVFMVEFIKKAPSPNESAELSDHSDSVESSSVYGVIDDGDWWRYERLLKERKAAPKKKPVAKNGSSKVNVGSTKTTKNHVFSLSFNGKIIARGVVDGDSLRILEGSSLVRRDSINIKSIANARKSLLSEKIVSYNKFRTDWKADSITQATNTIIGAPSNGLDKWIGEDGKTLREFLEEKKRF